MLGLSGLLFQWVGFSFEQLWKRKLFLTGELLVFWFIWQWIKKSRSREEKEKIEQEKILKELRKNSEEVTKETENYLLQLNNLESKINRFQLLSLAMRELGSLLRG
ncbi:MAG TPA: hypothetical protein DHV62_10135, partial [Elusimicrobia bacterium]|nr:hypothetical protein [Elusimicrobiota bacterium]